jgi:hypothetical protein
MDAPLNLSVGSIDLLKRQFPTIDTSGDYAFLFESDSVIYFACPPGVVLTLFDLTGKNTLDNPEKNQAS